MKKLFLIFIFSSLFLVGCGSELGNPSFSENRYEITSFAIATQEQEFCDYVLGSYLSELGLSSPNFAALKDEWNSITTSYAGSIDNSVEPMTRLELETFLIEHDYESLGKDLNVFIEDLNNRGNSLMSFTSADANYCVVLMYIER